MDTLKNLFPLSFNKTDDIAGAIVAILIYVVVGAVIGFLIGIVAKIPLIGLVFSLLGTLVEIYVFAGVVIAILNCTKVLK